MTEAVEQVHAFLKRRAVTRLYTDNHDSLRGRPVLEPYQRFTVDLGEFVVHPDLVALEADGETLVAIEAKGSGYRDAFAGLTQAELYQVAFHRTYLAADARFGKRAESDACLNFVLSRVCALRTTDPIRWHCPQTWNANDGGL